MAAPYDRPRHPVLLLLRTHSIGRRMGQTARLLEVREKVRQFNADAEMLISNRISFLPPQRLPRRVLAVRVFGRSLPVAFVAVFPSFQVPKVC